jgi:hypothetical protein
MIKCGSCQYEGQASADFVPVSLVSVWVGAREVIDFPVRRFARECVWCADRAANAGPERDAYWYASA